VKERLGIGDEQNVGSVGVKLCLIAAGVRDLYVNPQAKTKAWDTCAPEAILARAGGRLTDLRGAAIAYAGDLVHRRGLVASNGRVHDEVGGRYARADRCAGDDAELAPFERAAGRDRVEEVLHHARVGADLVEWRDHRLELALRVVAVGQCVAGQAVLLVDAHTARCGRGVGRAEHVARPARRTQRVEVVLDLPEPFEIDR
jgi:dienelactone hydrolase